MSKALETILVAPHVSEKAMGLADKHRQHVFEVRVDATKKEVQAAVEKMFKVEVERVNLINVKGKVKGRAQRLGRRKAWKKAYVTLVEGQDIQLSEVE